MAVAEVYLVVFVDAIHYSVKNDGLIKKAGGIRYFRDYG
jgi:hypothetical protein